MADLDTQLTTLIGERVNIELQNGRKFSNVLLAAYDTDCLNIIHASDLTEGYLIPSSSLVSIQQVND